MALTPRRIDAHDMVEFSIEMDGKSVICFVSLEALEDNFGATRQTDAATLKMNLDKIAPVAERVLEERSRASASSCEPRTSSITPTTLFGLCAAQHAG